MAPERIPGIEPVQGVFPSTRHAFQTSPTACWAVFATLAAVSLSLSLCLCLCVTLCLALSLSRSLKYTHSLSLALGTRARAQLRTLSHTRTQTHAQARTSSHNRDCHRRLSCGPTFPRGRGDMMPSVSRASSTACPGGSP